MFSIKVEATISYTFYADNIEDILKYVLEHGVCPSNKIYDDDVEIGSVTEYLVP